MTKPEITPAAEAALAAVMADPLLGLLGWSRRYSRGADLLVGSLGAVDVRLYVHRMDRPYPYRAIMPDGTGRNIKSLADALLWLLAGVQSLLHGCRAVDPVVTQLVAEGARLRAERDEAREAMLAAGRLVEAGNAEVESLRADVAERDADLACGQAMGDDADPLSDALALAARLAADLESARAEAATAYARGWEDGREAAHATADDAHAYNECCRRMAWDTASAIADLTPPTTPPQESADA